MYFSFTGLLSIPRPRLKAEMCCDGNRNPIKVFTSCWDTGGGYLNGDLGEEHGEKGKSAEIPEQSCSFSKGNILNSHRVGAGLCLIPPGSPLSTWALI